MAKEGFLASYTQWKIWADLSEVWQVVWECVPVMASSSAMETLQERIAKMKEMLGDWPCEDDTEASWVEHTVGEIQV